MSHVPTLSDHVRDRLEAALELEEQDPNRAIRIYRVAEKMNTQVSPAVVILALFGPPLAFVLAYHLAPLGGQYGVYIAGAIMAYLGFGPAVLYRLQFDDWGGRAAECSGRGSLLNLVLAPPLSMIEQVLVCMMAGGLLAVWFGPAAGVFVLLSEFGWIPDINSPGFQVAAGLAAGAAGLYALLAVLADMAYGDLWPPVGGLGYLFAHLRANTKGVLSYFAVWLSAPLFAILGGWSTGFILTPFVEVTILGCLSGVFLAIALSPRSLSVDNEVRIYLGLSRCNLRKRRYAAGRVPLRRMFVRNTSKGLLKKVDRSICNLLNGHLSLFWDSRTLGVRVADRHFTERLDRADELCGTKQYNEAVNIWETAADYWRPMIEVHRELMESDSWNEFLDRAENQGKLGSPGLFAGYFLLGIGCWIWWAARVLL